MPHSCSTMPMRSRSRTPPRAGSMPSTDTVPASRDRYPSRISTVVVLPAPFGPRSANTSPVATSKLDALDRLEGPVRLAELRDHDGRHPVSLHPGAWPPLGLPAHDGGAIGVDPGVGRRATDEGDHRGGLAAVMRGVIDDVLEERPERDAELRPFRVLVAHDAREVDSRRARSRTPAARSRGHPIGAAGQPWSRNRHRRESGSARRPSIA